VTEAAAAVVAMPRLVLSFGCFGSGLNGQPSFRECFSTTRAGGACYVWYSALLDQLNVVKATGMTPCFWAMILEPAQSFYPARILFQVIPRTIARCLQISVSTTLLFTSHSVGNPGTSKDCQPAG
jgi:hypothetical protein